MDAISTLALDHRRIRLLLSEFAQLNDRAKFRKTALADQFCLALTIHTRLEEEFLYPACGAIGATDLIEEGIDERATIRELVARIAGAEPGNQGYDEDVEALTEVVEQHVLAQENDLFERLRRTSLDLETLSIAMRRRSAQLGGTAESVFAPLKAVAEVPHRLPNRQGSAAKLRIV